MLSWFFRHAAGLELRAERKRLMSIMRKYDREKEEQAARARTARERPVKPPGPPYDPMDEDALLNFYLFEAMEERRRLQSIAPSGS
jgi:hypothetical protein